MPADGIPIAFMVAASENDAIGTGGRVPWRQEADLAFMRRRVAGCPLIMGRKTHEAIGRALPGHRNIVVTRQSRAFPECDTVGSMEEGIALAAADQPREIFIFGGGDIFRAALPYADRLYLTRIHTTSEGDAFFPGEQMDWSEWEKTREDRHPADAENEHAYTFFTYERKSPPPDLSAIAPR